MNKIQDIENMLQESPIREHLKRVDKNSIFEEERIVLNDIDNIVKKNIENANNPLKIVILGEVKAGKSTLVNALVGKMVSYTNVVEATAAIHEIKYSEEEKILIRRNNEKDILLNSMQELDIIINNNKGNQDFFCDINKILITTNTKRLQEITIVDTPGLNTVTSENEERTENYIANADVILWVLNAHHLGQSDVAEKIENVLDYGKPIICVINRIDEVQGDSDEIIQYVKNEMGYMFSEIFTTSAKDAWEGICEQDTTKFNKSNIQKLYTYIVNNIERNADEIQKAIILDSLKVQVERDISIHKNTYSRIDKLIIAIKKDTKNLELLNEQIKEGIINRLNNWISNEFFKKEKSELLSKDTKKVAELINEYCNNNYVEGLINEQYKKLNDYVQNEWSKNTDKLLEQLQTTNIEYNSSVDATNIREYTGKNDIIEGAKQGGATAGAVGLGLAGYAALLGPYAAYITIGSAVSAFLPPLAIAGIAGGAVYRYFGQDKKNKELIGEIDRFINNTQMSVKENVLDNMKNNIFEVSDYYYNNSAKMILSMLEQCNSSLEEVEVIQNELDKYIDSINRIRENYTI